MLKSNISRRVLIKDLATTALASSLIRAGGSAQAQEKPWWLGRGMPQEGADTPKIACAIDLAGGVTEAAIRGVVQLGVYHVLSGGPALPWTAGGLQPLVDRLRASGLALGNLMIGGFTNTIYGRPGRDEEIEKVKQSIQAAGQAGVAVVEYNFYAHRAMEGYYEESGRGGAGKTCRRLLLRARTPSLKCGPTSPTF